MYRVVYSKVFGILEWGGGGNHEHLESSPGLRNSVGALIKNAKSDDFERIQCESEKSVEIGSIQCEPVLLFLV